VERLVRHHHEVVAVGIKNGMIGKMPLTKELKFIPDVDTITLYVGEKNLPYWVDYMLSLKPKRIIFNPGAENYEFAKLARSKGIETVEACTLVMLSVGNY